MTTAQFLEICLRLEQIENKLDAGQKMDTVWLTRNDLMGKTPRHPVSWPGLGNTHYIKEAINSGLSVYGNRDQRFLEKEVLEFISNNL